MVAGCSGGCCSAAEWAEKSGTRPVYHCSRALHSLHAALPNVFSENFPITNKNSNFSICHFITLLNMIRNIKSPSQTDLVFIHCHLNPPGASQTKITLLSLVTLKYNLKFCMKAAAAGLLALKTSIRSCVERGVNIPQSTRPSLTLSLVSVSVCTVCTVQISLPICCRLPGWLLGGCVPVHNPHGDMGNTMPLTDIYYIPQHGACC